MKKNLIIFLTIITIALSIGLITNKSIKVFADEPISEQITVIGESSTKLSADMAKINCNISFLDKTLEIAKDNAFNKYTQAKTVLKEFGISNENVNLIYFSTHPNYDYSLDRTLLGYNANLSFEFDLDSLESIKPCIDKLIKLGDININNVNYQVKDYVAEYNRVLQEAILNASEKAKTILNKQEVKILSIVEEETYNSCCMYKNFIQDAEESDFNNKISLSAKVKVIFV